ncbi:S1C family serine protease [Macrococcus lamae]|uniref:Serine protease HtrA-like n=1 Tax=Macrococcus lamae TaxID=198484 RepID=A0A4R6BTP8_9STAP|nr:trypsin-like peptidase domain-containing protein [Macrococcus lamae]TDM07649.1 trypsin-like serine protease [Macrococcus lamae]
MTINEEQEHIQKALHPTPSAPVKRKSVFPYALLGGVLGSVLTVGAMQLPLLDQHNDNAGTVTTVNDSKDSYNVSKTSNQKNLADMIDQISPAIVGVINMQKADSSNPFAPAQSKEQETGTGSGVIYQADNNASYIVTNNHVVEGATNIKVQLSTGKQYDAELIGTDALTDIAVLKVNNQLNIKPVTFGDSSGIRTGDTVYAIGNPLGLDFANSVTEGIVSAKERTMDVSTSAGTSSVKAIQTDAAINPGNSGGALLNAGGQLIGINSMKISSTEVEGIGFAIPSNDVKTIIEQIVKNGKVIRPYMGLALTSADSIPTQYLNELGIDSNKGVIVAQTDDYAGKVFDEGDLITEVDGEKVASDSELKSYIYQNKKAGDTVKFTIIRDGSTKEVELTLRSTKDQTN